MMNDLDLVVALTDAGARRPASIRPRESFSMRLACLVTAPLWITVIAAAGLGRLVRGRLPLIVLHERVGYRRARLWVPKVATARVDTNERRLAGLVERASGPPVELEVDGCFERWLRVTGVDELPQLLLVLAGTMRLVGPRPVTSSELDEMAVGDSEVGVDHLQPGLVGLWQVLDRHSYDLVERRNLDLTMVDNWSSKLRRALLGLSFRQASNRIWHR